MAPGAGDLVSRRGHVGHMVKVHCFFKIFLATHRHRMDKLGYSCGSAGVVNFMAPGVEVLWWGMSM